MRRWLAIALLLAGCGDDYVSEEALTWAPVTYSASDAPRVARVPPVAAWDEAPLPLSVEGEDSGKDGILYSVALAHYWLLDNQASDGDYLYDYNAQTGESEDTSSVIQMLATAWSQVLVHRFVDRPELALAAYRATMRHYPGLRRDGDLAHLGSTARSAFLFFVLVELEDAMGMSRFTEDVDALGQFFLHQVNEDGCIWTTYPHSGTCAAGHSEFPVGQAMVALERMHRRTGEARWLDALERAARFYRGYYEGVDFRDEIYFVPWATGPMVGLLLERPDPDLEAFVFEMADHQVGDQYLDEGDPLRLGGFKRRSGRVPTWSAASMVEGIVDAYRLAEARGDRERTRRYRQAGILGAKFLMSLQYRASNVGGFDLADPERAIGAYHFSNEEPESDFSMHWLRTDFMDHFAITMLKTLTYLDLPETYPGEGFAR